MVKIRRNSKIQKIEKAVTIVTIITHVPSMTIQIVKVSKLSNMAPHHSKLIHFVAFHLLFTLGFFVGQPFPTTTGSAA